MNNELLNCGNVFLLFMNSHGAIQSSNPNIQRYVIDQSHKVIVKYIDY